MSRSVRESDYTQAGGAATNANFTGHWIKLADLVSIGFQVNLTGTGNPTGTFTFEVTDDPDPVNRATMTPTPVSTSGWQGGVTNPAGTGAALNFLAWADPCPRAEWGRFKYTASSGGSASKLLQIAFSGQGRG